MKKINRLLAILLAFAVVITTFSSDLTTARVFATEEETVIDSEDKINTVEKEEIPVVSEASTEESTEETAGLAEGEGTGATNEDEILDEDASVTGADIEGTVPAVVEEAEEEEEEEDEEAKILYAYESGIKITLKADPGVLPEDAELRVSAIEDTDEVKVSEEEVKDAIDEVVEEEVTATYSFDINIYSESKGDPEDNGYVQPNTDKGDITITFDNIDEAKDEDVSLSVFYVNEKEDGEISVEEVAKGSKDSTDDAITFEPEHFSVYSVVLKTSANSGKSFELKQVDVGLNEINGKGTITINDINKDSITADELKAKIAGSTPNGYSLIGIYAKGGMGKRYVVSRVYVEDGTLYYDDQGGDWHRVAYAQGIYAVYRSNEQKTTDHHIDLGFEKADFEKYNTKNTDVLVKIGNGQYHKMTVEQSVYKDNYDGKDYYEFRYTSTTGAIAANQDITFKVEINGRQVGNTMVCGPRKNLEAFERCFKAHYTSQTTYGFDYVSNFSQDFLNNAIVNYHSNFGDDPDTVVDTENVSWTTPNVNETTKQHNYKAAYPANKQKKPDATFEGWGMKDHEGKIVKIVGPTITVTKGTTTDLYAIWKDNKKINLDFLDYDRKTKLQETKQVFASYQYSTNDYKGKTPTRTGYTFSKWSNPEVDKDGNVKYIAQYTPYQYEIEFHKNAPANETVTGTMAKMTLKYDESKKLTKNSYTCEFYEFKGWATSSDSKVVAYTNEQLVKNLTDINNKVIDLYAIWDKVTSQTVHFYLLTDSKSIPGDSSGQPKADYYPVADDEYYSWEGTANTLKFASGKDSRGNLYDRSDDRENNKVNKEILSRPTDKIETYLHSTYSNSINEDDVTWYVYKKQDDGYHIDGYPTGSVTYVANFEGENVPENHVDSKIRLNKTTATYAVKSYEAAFGSTREGYTFLGWSTDASNGKVVYSANNLGNIALKEHLTLYAEWAKNVDYTVNFVTQDENGSFVDSDNKYHVYATKTYSVQVKPGEEITVSAQKLTNYTRTFDLQINDPTNNVTKFSPRFTKNGVGYTVVDSENGWNTTITNEDGEYVINVLFTRDDLNVELVVTSASNTWYYDGADHSDNEFEYSPLRGDYEVTSITTSATVKNVGDTAENNNIISEFTVKDKQSGATYSYKVVDGKVYTTSGKLVTSISVSFGKLTIKPRTVTLTSSTITKEFDGRALTANNSKQADAKKITASQYVDQEKTATTEEKHEGFVKGEGIDPEKIKFTGSRTYNEGIDPKPSAGPYGVGLKENIFDDSDDDADTFTALNSNTKPENYIIEKQYGDIIITDRTDKYVVYVKLGADGMGGRTVLPYNGTEQTADLSVRVYAEKKNVLDTLRQAGEQVLSTVLQLGVLVVNAEEGDEGAPAIEGTKIDAVNDEIDGMQVVIDNLYISGGKGTNVRTYPVWLNTEHMTIMTTIAGKDVDISKQVRIEVVNDNPKVDEEAAVLQDAAFASADELLKIGELEITPIALTIKADDKTKAYRATDPEFTASILGLVDADKVYAEDIAKALKPNYSFDRDPGEDAGGKYAIHVILGRKDIPYFREVNSVSELKEAKPVIFLDDEYMYLLFDPETEENVILSNYIPETADGWLTIGRPSSDDDDDNPTTVDDTPVAAAPAPAVLGAQRQLPAEQPAVLGARRAGTSDTSIIGSIITIIVAAAIAFSMIFIKRKKKEEQ